MKTFSRPLVSAQTPVPWHLGVVPALNAYGNGDFPAWGNDDFSKQQSIFVGFFWAHAIWVVKQPMSNHSLDGNPHSFNQCNRQYLMYIGPQYVNLEYGQS